MQTVNISGLDHAAVLAALYNASKPLGMGIYQFTPEDMSMGEAVELLEKYKYFDYLKGRVMKIGFEGHNLRDDMLRIDLYDRDNGDGAAQRAINSLRGV